MSDDPYFVPLAFRDVQPSMQELWNGLQNETLPDAARTLFSPIPEFQLFDTQNDPYEVNNLIDDSNYDDIRKSLVATLNEWTKNYPDMSRVSEAEMIEAMWPNGEHPMTASPIISQSKKEGRTLISLMTEKEGASIGYRYAPASDDWVIYTEPFELSEGSSLQANAIRYGFAESDVTVWNAEN